MLYIFYCFIFETNNKIMEKLTVSNSCVNCSNINEQKKCNIHQVIVSEKFTCEEFSLSGD